MRLPVLLADAAKCAASRGCVGTTRHTRSPSRLLLPSRSPGQGDRISTHGRSQSRQTRPCSDNGFIKTKPISPLFATRSGLLSAGSKVRKEFGDDIRMPRHGELVARRLTVRACDACSRLGGDECTGGVIPRVETALVVRIESASGHRAQVKRGGTEAADVADVSDERAKEVGIRVA